MNGSRESHHPSSHFDPSLPPLLSFVSTFFIPHLLCTSLFHRLPCFPCLCRNFRSSIYIYVCPSLRIHFSSFFPFCKTTFSSLIFLALSSTIRAIQPSSMLGYLHTPVTEFKMFFASLLPDPTNRLAAFFLLEGRSLLTNLRKLFENVEKIICCLLYFLNLFQDKFKANRIFRYITIISLSITFIF